MGGGAIGSLIPGAGTAGGAIAGGGALGAWGNRIADVYEGKQPNLWGDLTEGAITGLTGAIGPAMPALGASVGQVGKFIGQNAALGGLQEAVALPFRKAAQTGEWNMPSLNEFGSAIGGGAAFGGAAGLGFGLGGKYFGSPASPNLPPPPDANVSAGGPPPDIPGRTGWELPPPPKQRTGWEIEPEYNPPTPKPIRTDVPFIGPSADPELAVTRLVERRTNEIQAEYRLAMQQGDTATMAALRQEFEDLKRATAQRQQEPQRQLGPERWEPTPDPFVDIPFSRPSQDPLPQSGGFESGGQGTFFGPRPGGQMGLPLEPADPRIPDDGAVQGEIPFDRFMVGGRETPVENIRNQDPNAFGGILGPQVGRFPAGQGMLPFDMGSMPTMDSFANVRSRPPEPPPPPPAPPPPPPTDMGGGGGMPTQPTQPPIIPSAPPPPIVNGPSLMEQMAPPAPAPAVARVPNIVEINKIQKQLSELIALRKSAQVSGETELVAALDRQIAKLQEQFRTMKATVAQAAVTPPTQQETHPAQPPVQQAAPAIRPEVMAQYTPEKVAKAIAEIKAGIEDAKRLRQAAVEAGDQALINRANQLMEEWRSQYEIYGYNVFGKPKSNVGKSTTQHPFRPGDLTIEGDVATIKFPSADIHRWLVNQGFRSSIHRSPEGLVQMIRDPGAIPLETVAPIQRPRGTGSTFEKAMQAKVGKGVVIPEGMTAVMPGEDVVVPVAQGEKKAYINNMAANNYHPVGRTHDGKSIVFREAKPVQPETAQFPIGKKILERLKKPTNLLGVMSMMDPNIDPHLALAAMAANTLGDPAVLVQQIGKKYKAMLKAAKDMNEVRFILSDGTMLKGPDPGIDVGRIAASSLGLKPEVVKRSGIIDIQNSHAQVHGPISEPQSKALVRAVTEADPDEPYIFVSTFDATGKKSGFQKFQANATPQTIQQWVNSKFAPPQVQGPFGKAAQSAVQQAQVVKQRMGIGQGATPKATKPPVLNAQGQALPDVNYVEEMLNFPTNATTTGDFSPPGKQGLGQITRPEFWTNLPNLLKGLSPAAYKKMDDYIANHPLHAKTFDPATGKFNPSLADRMNIQHLRVASDPRPGKRAENVASRWLETGAFLGPNKIAGVPNPARELYNVSAGAVIRATNRSFVAFMNGLSTEVSWKIAKNMQQMSMQGLNTGRAPMPGVLGGMKLPDWAGGKHVGFSKNYTPEEAINLDPFLNDKAAKELGDFINTSLGMAPKKIEGVPWKNWEMNFEKASGVMNKLLFSPGLLFSRMRMLWPGTYVMASPQMRKEYLRSALGTAAAWYGITEVMKAAGGDDVEVNNDWTNADFGKVRVGNTRMDPGGGFLQFLVAYGRMYEGGWTSSATQQKHEFGEGINARTQFSNLFEFGANKLNPIAKFALDLARSSEYQPFHTNDRLLQLFTPLIVQDAIELANEDPDLLPWLAPISVGLGTQTYSRGESEGKLVSPENDWLLKGNEGLKAFNPFSQPTGRQ
jgi:hypothetical protein